MSHQVDSHLLPQIRRYGAFDIGQCFNCGNCTAVCSLTKESEGFPRRAIRYAQVGMAQRLLSDRGLWLCYSCGECTRTCPRQAGPSEFMAALRRYAIARQDPTGIGRVMYGSAIGNLLVFAVFSAVFMLLLLWKKGDMNGRRLALFDYLPGPWIHDLGVALFVVVGLAAAGGVASMCVRLTAAWRAAGRPLPWRRLPAALAFGFKESLAQFRYRKCDSQSADEPNVRPKPWLTHAMILWGFLGLLAATTLDFLFKPIGSYVPLWGPVRLLGTLAGAVCLYGSTIVIWRRWKHSATTYSHGMFSDWFFLLLLWVTVFTGFVTELAVYLPSPSRAAYIIFLAHVVLAMDLIALVPATKFAHVVYRPLALALHHWLRTEEGGTPLN